MITHRLAILLTVCVATGLTLAATAQPAAGAAPSPNSAPAILRDAGIDNHEGAQVPADLPFRDETGRDVTLGEYFNRRPVILALVYYQCPMLCTMVLNDLTRTLNSLSETAGKEFEVVVVSFDPSETPELAAGKKRQYMRAYRRPGSESGWHFLTGPRESIAALTARVGFRYAWDEKHKLWAHASGLVVLTPAGRISRYLYGIDYAPPDLRGALNRAEAGDISTAEPARTVLYCFSYDPATGKYGVIVMRVLRLCGIATVALFVGSVWLTVRRDRRAALSGTALHPVGAPPRSDG